MIQSCTQFTAAFIIARPFDLMLSCIKARSNPWIYAAEFDGRIEPLSISMKKFLTDDGSPIIEIVRQEGIEIKI